MHSNDHPVHIPNFAAVEAHDVLSPFVISSTPSRSSFELSNMHALNALVPFEMLASKRVDTMSKFCGAMVMSDE